jgi:AbrB family looped-hinge helix DNA binding protein
VRIDIDENGRIVIPKSMCEDLGINGPGELELTEFKGKLELTAPDRAAHIEIRDGCAVIVPDQPVPPLTVEMTREAIERSRFRY